MNNFNRLLNKIKENNVYEKLKSESAYDEFNIAKQNLSKEVNKLNNIIDTLKEDQWNFLFLKK